MNRHQKRALSSIHWLLLIILMLSACQGPPPTLDLATGTATRQRPSSTASPLPSRTPGPESTPAAAPTKIITKTLTPKLSLTPLPLGLPPLTSGRLSQLEQLAVWGNGAAHEFALSGDGNLLAVGTALGAFIYDSFDFRFYTLLRSEQPVRAIAFSPDNQLLAVMAGDEQIMIFSQDTFTKENELKISTLPKPGEASQALFFSPESDALTLLSESRDQIDINQWETDAWKPTASFSINASQASFANPDVGVVGVVTADNLILHSLALPGDFRTLPLPNALREPLPGGQTTPPAAIVPAVEGDFLLLDQGGAITHWDLVHNTLAFQLEIDAREAGDPCEADPNTCANESGGGSLPCPDEPPEMETPGRLIAITPDDQRMLISLSANQTELRTTRSGELIWSVETGYTKAMFSLAYRFVLGLRPDGVFEKRDLLDGELLSTFKQHPSLFYALAFSPDGSLLAAGFSDGWIRMFDTRTGEMLGILEGSAHSLAFSPGGEWLAAGLADGALRVFNLQAGNRFDLGPGHAGPVTALAFSPDGTQLTSTSQDCTLNHWNFKGRYRTELIVPMEDNPHPVSALGRSAETQDLFIAAGKNILVEDEEDITPIFSAGPGDLIEDIALTGDGELLAGGGSSLWLLSKAPSGWQPQSIPISTAAEDEVYRVAFLPGSHVLLAAAKQTLSFYEINPRQQPTLLHTLPLPPSLDRPVDLTLSPGGSLIAIGSANGLIHIFGSP